ncbi:hypothetical protein MO973_14545 [Paenibacillus sp. TRM 82003]|nr:hypothetical protein [Paenibacillus sp. TRM 82003]
MAVIRSKKDTEMFLEQFEAFAAWDETGGKRYFVLADRERGGAWTLMRYPGGAWTIHGKGDDYCDEDELPLTSEEALDFVWKHRAAVNKAVPETA